MFPDSFLALFSQFSHCDIELFVEPPNYGNCQKDEKQCRQNDFLVQINRIYLARGQKTKQVNQHHHRNCSNEVSDIRQTQGILRALESAEKAFLQVCLGIFPDVANCPFYDMVHVHKKVNSF